MAEHTREVVTTHVWVIKLHEEDRDFSELLEMVNSALDAIEDGEHLPSKYTATYAVEERDMCEQLVIRVSVTEALPE